MYDDVVWWLVMCIICFCFFLCFFCYFFFQAEDGIRDLVRSRGLGDVYKRQVFAFYTCFNNFRHKLQIRFHIKASLIC